MDEQAAFETRAVLAPRRAVWNRLVVVVPVLAFGLVAWAGLHGPRSDANQAAEAAPPSVAAPTNVLAAAAPPTPFVEPNYPTTVLGFEVRRLDDVQPGRLSPGQVTAIAGWFVATSITDCPPLDALFRPAVRGATDSWAYCDRSGVLYASNPEVEQRSSTSVAARLLIGVVVPAELEVIGTQATPVVVLGHFLDSNAGCHRSAVCRGELAVDYLPWAAGTERSLVVGSSEPASGQPALPADGVNRLTGG